MSQPLRLAVLTCGRPMAFFCIFFYINIFLLPFYQKNKKENVAATYPNGAVLSRLTHMWHYIMKETGYGIVSILSNTTVTNYFTIFLQNVDVTNLLLVFI